MKKITTTLIAAVTILLSFTGCDKYHRDRYTGIWEFETTVKLFNTNEETIDEDTIYYSGKISLGVSENQLIVKYTENDEVIVWLDEDENVFSASASNGGKFPCGYFTEKNKVFFILGWYNYDEGLAVGSENHIVQGIKKGRR